MKYKTTNVFATVLNTFVRRSAETLDSHFMHGKNEMKNTRSKTCQGSLPRMGQRGKHP